MAGKSFWLSWKLEAAGTILGESERFVPYSVGGGVERTIRYLPKGEIVRDIGAGCCICQEEAAGLCRPCEIRVLQRRVVAQRDMQLRGT